MTVLNHLPRNFPACVVLALAAGIWGTALLGTMDLGEFSSYRMRFVLCPVIGTGLTIFFVQQFLAVRALAMLLLLAVAVILDAAFVVDSSARLIMTSLAYAWSILGMVLVASPYLMRDWIAWIFRNETWCRAACLPAVVLGIALICLACVSY